MMPALLVISDGGRRQNRWRSYQRSLSMPKDYQSNAMIASAVWVACWLVRWLLDRMGGGNGGVGAVVGVAVGACAAMAITGGALKWLDRLRRK